MLSKPTILVVEVHWKASLLRSEQPDFREQLSEQVSCTRTDGASPESQCDDWLIG